MGSDSVMQVNQLSGMPLLDGNIQKYRVKCSAVGAWHPPHFRLQRMASKLLSIQESERKRIAKDLHDGLGQSLTIIKLTLAITAQQLANGAIVEVSESLQQLSHKAHEALEEMRRVSMDLRPPMIDDLGILATLSWLFRDLESACPGIKVEKDFCVLESHIPSALKITLYRIIQEATSNIIKHANADRIRVSLVSSGDTLNLNVTDNGSGFDTAEMTNRSGSSRGFGLLTMRERASLSGGAYTIDSRAGKGTQVCVSWHLDSLPDVL